MTTETVIKCSREAESHRGGLRRIHGKMVCEQCYARENGRDLKKGAGRPVLCPRCREPLMTRYRGGGVSVKSMSMRGRKVILTCSCGYKKTIKNPFGGPSDRNEAARQRLQSESSRKSQEALRTPKEKQDEAKNCLL